MIYRIYGQKDATIYEDNDRTIQNTGGDQILEVTKIYDVRTNEDWLGSSRILIKFDISSISQSIVDGTISASGPTEFYLNLTSVAENEVQSEYTLNVYPISGSWDGGVGKYSHSPIVTDGASWVYRSGTTAWGTTTTPVFNDIIAPTIPTDGIVLYEGFGNGSIGNAFLTESINDVAGNTPFIFIENEKLIISGSTYAGTTLVFPVDLELGKTYGLQFQLDPGTFSDIQFRLQDPNGVIKTNGAFGDYEHLTITTPTTQSFEITATDAGTHNLRYTFFSATDTVYANKTASFDEIYVYEKLGDLTVWETFTLNEGKFKLRNVVNNTNFLPPTMATSESKLYVFSDNVGGGDATYVKSLSSTLEYTLTADIAAGDYPEIGFTIYDTYGIKLRSGVTNLQSAYSGSVTQSITFTPSVSGDYTFAYTFFDSGSAGATGSIDNFKITYSGSLPPSLTSAAGYYKNEGGATWYSSSVAGTNVSQLFNKYTTDLNVNVTSYVNDWLSGSRPNDGFIVKRNAADEGDAIRYGSSKFFSSETNTIYVPTLEVRWDDSQFVTGTLSSLTANNITLYPKNLLSEYKESSKARIRMVGRERYPTRTFSSTSLLTTIKYLPQTTYYQVRDIETNLVLIPFNTTYTKLSCDATGNYFDFWFNTLQPERFYQFEFRVDVGETQSYFNNYIFKVVR